jgi:hypothetical protein
VFMSTTGTAKGLTFIASVMIHQPAT